MNQIAFDIFSSHYCEESLALRAERPDLYQYVTPLDVTSAVENTLAMMADNPMAVYYGTLGFERTCERLGIGHTKPAIFKYLEIKV